MRTILLGPQRRPTIGSLGVPGPFATVTAGWQEREPDDGELRSLLGGEASGLGLYGRWLDVQERDPEYAAAARALAGVLAELADLYLLRLDYALQAVYTLQKRSAGAALGEAVLGEAVLGEAVLGEAVLGEAVLGEAVEAVRELDAAHLARVNEVRGEFFERLRPHDRPVIAAHRAAVASIAGSAAALVVAGGHVGVLAEVLHLFNVAASLPSSAAVIAWSAGAMAMADRIVLFGDRSAHGPGHAEVYGSGLSVVREVVLLPHAKARLLLDDAPRMAVFARRFAPAACVVLEAGTRVELSADGGLPAGTRVLGRDGHVCSLGEAA